jgi:hypothetical protein
LLAFGLLLWGYINRGWTPEKLTRAIDKALPPGTPKADVAEWLDSKGIQYSYSSESNQEWTSVIYAFIPNANVHPILRGEINIDSNFDDQDRLT